jgi:hypothetical protein
MITQFPNCYSCLHTDRVAKVRHLKVRDALLASKGTFTRFLTDDDYFGTVVNLADKAKAALVRAHTTELENWIIRIIFQAGGTKAKSNSKALGSKLATFNSQCPGSEFAKLVFPPLWQHAKPIYQEHVAAQKKEKKVKVGQKSEIS